MYCADNGASGEGSPNGSVNENKFFNSFPDTIEDNMPLLDKLGGPDGYNHYPTGWAVAFSTPYRMFKRYSYQGGVCDPLVVHWPAGIKARGEVRDQYHHCTDIVPTILECCGVEMPDKVGGVEQTPLPGVSMRYSFDDADSPTTKQIQYYEMLGTRALWHQGWKAVAEHGPAPVGLGNFPNDRWQLFHTDKDRAEAHDLAEQHPEKVSELINLWLEEAKKYDVLPLNDLTHGSRSASWSSTCRCRPAGSTRTTRARRRCPRRRRRTRTATRTRSSPTSSSRADTEGVIFAQGSRFGGHSLFVKDGKISYVFNFLGIPPEQQVVGRRAHLRTPRDRGRVHQGAHRRVPGAARDAEAARRR